METFDAAIVGSGFGGSVMAYRLAQGGLSVCILERGQAYPPGSFSRTPVDMRRNFWDPSEQRFGLFNIWSFRGMGAVVSAGLGGGSLIYANVFIRKDERWFVDPVLGADGRWPIGRRELDPHYDAVHKIINPVPYPQEYQKNNKTSAMQRAAEKLGIPQTAGDGDPAGPQWYLPDLAVTFTEPGHATARPARVFDPGNNLHGMPRETCRLCGECDVGCNFGSKNTLDYNYLSLAGPKATIRTLCEVKDFRPTADGYLVTYVNHEDRQRTTPGQIDRANARQLLAKRLILSAGTFGSTYLLLKMKAAGILPALSPTLGTRFSGNGDLLMFATRCRNRDQSPNVLNASRAPVITSTFRFPDGEDDGTMQRGCYLQDAGYPLVTDYVWEMLDRGLLSRAARFAASFIARWLHRAPGGEIDQQLGELFGTAALSSTSMPLLGMGRDVPDGVMSTRKDAVTGVPLLALDWNDKRSRGYYKRAIGYGRDVAEALGGRYTANPLTLLFNNLITVHPLGGCPMGIDEQRGVVSDVGEVFQYPGLYVADGSIMPGPVGANPSFTIAALSDRIADRILNM